MEKFRRIAKPVSQLLVFGLLSLSLHLPAAQAGMIGTETIANAAQAQQSRVRLQEALNRDGVKAALVARGVDPSQVQARVDSLTDEEAQALSGKMDQLPAGGDGFLGAVVFIFLVLLVTDILGFTNIFPFVKHPATKR